jgi:hypothetical protein
LRTLLQNENVMSFACNIACGDKAIVTSPHNEDVLKLLHQTLRLRIPLTSGMGRKQAFLVWGRGGVSLADPIPVAGEGEEYAVLSLWLRNGSTSPFPHKVM